MENEKQNLDTGRTEQKEIGPLSPAVRRMARENNIDLAMVQGTGANGRITLHDLQMYTEGVRTSNLSF